jgi:hypothetical protein
MEVALIFPVVALVIAALAVVYGRWGPGKLGNREFGARRREGESGRPDRPYWMGPGSGPGSTGLGGMDGGL